MRLFQGAALSEPVFGVSVADPFFNSLLVLLQVAAIKSLVGTTIYKTSHRVRI